MTKRFNDIFKSPFIYNIGDVGTTWAEFQRVVGETTNKNEIEEFNRRMLKEYPSFTIKSYSLNVYPDEKVHYANEVNFVIATFTFAKPHKNTMYFIKLSLCFKVQSGVHVKFNTVSHGYRILEEDARELIIKWIEDNAKRGNSKFSTFIDSLIGLYISGEKL